MYRVLSLQDFGVKRVRAFNECLKGRPVMARGTFSAVFAADTPESVFKLTVDRSHYMYLTEYFLAHHSHKPKVLNDFGVVGTTAAGHNLFLVEVERLEPLPVCSARRDLNSIMRKIRNNRRINVPALFPDSLEEFKALPNSFQAFLRDLNLFITDSGAAADLCVAQNYMLRSSDATLVASDPIFDKVLMDKSSRAKFGV